MTEVITDPDGRDGGRPEPVAEPWLIGLDIDGTVLHEDGMLSEAVEAAVHRVRDLGHHVTLATGRSVFATIPVLERLGIVPEYVVCANGAITLQRDTSRATGYRRQRVETFDPTDVLQTIRGALGEASYAVEDPTGLYRFTGSFPEGTLGSSSQKVRFEDLLNHPATRVVVISPGHAVEDFLTIVEDMGLHKVSYNVGWTAWLDIAPDGVNKGTALEWVRGELGVPRDRVLVIGDGRNDIDMFIWAGAEGGRAVAMGQAPPEVVEVATESTTTDLEDGVAAVLGAFADASEWTR